MNFLEVVFEFCSIIDGAYEVPEQPLKPSSPTETHKEARRSETSVAIIFLCLC